MRSDIYFNDIFVAPKTFEEVKNMSLKDFKALCKDTNIYSDTFCLGCRSQSQ